MIIEVVSPCRLSLAGGGSDLPNYYHSPSRGGESGGVVVSLAINIYQRIRLYQGEDLASDKYISLNDVQFIRTFTKALGVEANVVHTFDGETQSGLGSSGALAVALTKGLSILKGDDYINYKCAMRAWEIENSFNFTGVQDHFASTYGGGNIFYFGKEFERLELIRDDITDLTSHLVLFHTPKRQVNVQEKMRTLTVRQIKNIDRIKAYADVAIDAIYEKDFKKLGEVMSATWEEKKSSNPQATTRQIEKIIDKGLKEGAYGAKLCGSGGGGYMVFVVNPKKKKEFLTAMEGLAEHVDFSVDFNGVQARVL